MSAKEKKLTIIQLYLHLLTQTKSSFHAFILPTNSSSAGNQTMRPYLKIEGLCRSPWILKSVTLTYRGGLCVLKKIFYKQFNWWHYDWSSVSSTFSFFSPSYLCNSYNLNYFTYHINGFKTDWSQTYCFWKFTSWFHYFETERNYFGRQKKINHFLFISLKILKAHINPINSIKCFLNFKIYDEKDQEIINSQNASHPIKLSASKNNEIHSNKTSEGRRRKAKEEHGKTQQSNKSQTNTFFIRHMLDYEVTGASEWIQLPWLKRQ